MSFNPFINGGGGTSSEDKVARAEIAAIKDGETLDSFSDVETALDNKADSTTTYTKAEVDTALGNKADKSTTYTKTEVDTALGNKVDKVSGKGLSTNDYTDVEKTKLAGIAEGAEVNEIESIKVNNTTINPDANKVVNITVPTTAADVSALPDTTKYAAALSLKINSSTFVMTGQLKDQNGDNLGTAQTIDLPLESVVVGGSYNSQTKKVVLTLQNGNIIEFSVADLVSGLQTELSASNKLNPAYIDYDSTHRAVSDTEKSVWNSKQNALSSTQLDAVNSGIDSTKVAQIEMNKNNISSNWGAKNLLVNRGSLRKISADDDITYTWVNGDVSVTGKKLSEGETYVNVIPVTPLSDLGLSDKVVISNNGTKCFLAVIFWSNTLGPSSIYEIVSGSNIIDVPSGYTHIMARLGVKEGVKGTINETIQPMICTKAQWDISHEYQPYPFSNAELTMAEKQNENNISKDEAALVELVDGGAKNDLEFDAIGTVTTYGTTYESNGVKFTLNADNTVTFERISTSSSIASCLLILNGTIHDVSSYCDGNHILSGCPSGGSGNTYEIMATVIGGPYTKRDYGTGVILDSASGMEPYIQLMVRSGFTGTATFKPMICTKAAWGISHAYQPYAMSNAELTQTIGDINTVLEEVL